MSTKRPKRHKQRSCGWLQWYICPDVFLFGLLLYDTYKNEFLSFFRNLPKRPKAHGIWEIHDLLVVHCNSARVIMFMYLFILVFFRSFALRHMTDCLLKRQTLHKGLVVYYNGTFISSFLVPCFTAHTEMSFCLPFEIYRNSQKRTA